jgi:short-subunit dehydrogenase
MESILITGANSGLGQALALAYAAPEISLFLSGRNAERLDLVAQQCRDKGAVVHTTSLDVTDKPGMKAWIDSCDHIQPLDLVIANAGISNHGVKFDVEMSQKIFDINLQGVLNTIYPAYERMIPRKRGQLVLMSSLAGVCGVSREPAYSASKSAVKEFGVMLGGQLKKHGISVSVICPGFVKSALTDKNRYKMPFIMSAEKAARIMKSGIGKKKLLITFPRIMYLAARLGSMLPPRVLLFLARGFREFEK